MSLILSPILKNMAFDSNTATVNRFDPTGSDASGMTDTTGCGAAITDFIVATLGILRRGEGADEAGLSIIDPAEVPVVFLPLIHQIINPNTL